MTHTQNHQRHMWAIATLVAMLSLFLQPNIPVFAASAWAPTLLVNTEAFQIIDNSDTAATQLEIRFGDVVGQRLFYDRTNLRFQFTRSIFIAGDVTATGSITAMRVLSGQSLRVSAGGADIHGPLAVSGAIRTDSNFTLNDDVDSSDVVLTFGSDTLSETFTWLNSADKFYLTDDLDVRGTISGTSLKIWGSGPHTISGSLIVEGSMSGATIEGANLRDCQGTANKLTYDVATKKFKCESDQTGGTTGGGGNWSNTGSLKAFFDTKYVDVAGDTMTGALVIDMQNTTTGTGLILREKAYFGSGAVLSGALLLQGNQNSRTPSQAPAGMLKTYSQDIANRQMLSARSQFGSGYSLQPALFSKMVMMLSTGGGTTVNGYGTTVTNDTTVSHPAADQTFGYMTNFATAATLNDTAGTSSVNTTFFRGSTGVANGFFFNARVGVVDVTSIRTFVGLANQTIATMVGNDNPAGHTIGFQFSTNRADANWQFQTKDNTTQNVINTTVPFTANHVYDLSFYCSNTCTTVYWQVDDLTVGTTVEGSTSSNLPGGSTALRQIVGVSALTATAKNIRMQHVYTEADR